MSKIAISPGATGDAVFTLQAPSTDTSRTLTLPDNSGTLLSNASTFAGTGPAFGAYQGTAQTFANGVYTKVTFDVEEFDTNNNFASSRFTPTVAGYYTVTARIQILPTSEALPTLYKNGSEFKRFTYSTSASTSYEWGGTVSCIYMNGTTDYIEFYMFQSSGGASKTSGAGQAVTYFNGAMVRAA